MKIALNKCFGGFTLTEPIYNELGITWDGYGYLENADLNIESDNYLAYRSDKRLIEAIEKIGEKKASGCFSDVRIIEIPDDMESEIHDYDGLEILRETHRYW